MWAGDLVSARLLARKGIVDPTDFASLLAWRLESGGKIPSEPDIPDVPDEPDVPVEPANPYTWEGVAQNIENGTYRDVYKIGDEVPLDLGSEGVINMQVAAFDTDTLSDGSGTAAITWVAKELLATSKRMNPQLVEATEGTGTIGGWEKCEMRAYLQSTIKPLIPVNVAGIIEEVSKNHAAYDTAGSLFTQTTTDEVWLPAQTELQYASNVYGALFPSDSSAVKKKYGSSTAIAWFLRDAKTSGNFCTVNAYGSRQNGTAAASARGVCLGFCTGKSK